MAVLRCTEPFAFSDRGVERVVRAGDLVDEKDPLVKGREQWFESVDSTVHRMTDRSHESSASAPTAAKATKASAAKKSAG